MNGFTWKANEPHIHEIWIYGMIPEGVLTMGPYSEAVGRERAFQKDFPEHDVFESHPSLPLQSISCFSQLLHPSLADASRRQVDTLRTSPHELRGPDAALQRHEVEAGGGGVVSVEREAAEGGTHVR